jgi:FAD:protein FMN transferase
MTGGCLTILQIKMSKYLVLAFALLVLGCRQQSHAYISKNGEAFGVDYHIQYECRDLNFDSSIDSIIKDIALNLDEKSKTSSIARFNAAKDTFLIQESDDHFEALWRKSKLFYILTNGSLDPSLTALYRYYGSGYNHSNDTIKVDKAAINLLLKAKSFATINITEVGNKKYIIKENPGTVISFEAIISGYLVDQIVGYFNLHKINNYIVEHGGKCRALGTDINKNQWTYGINRPKEGADSQFKELPLVISNYSIATSGAYTSSVESRGQQYAMFVDPKSGISRQSDVLSATVIADECITADAYATAFITLGLEKSLAILTKTKNVNACFVYDTEGDGNFEFRISDRFSTFYKDNEQQ